ncbi:MAG: LysM peptidoglycan-binding domain-containing protein [Marinomonas foliarum]
MSNKTYVIKEGDQLLKIAVEQGVSYLKLLELNPQYQANPNLIHPGETLILPSDEDATSTAEPKEKESIPPIDPNAIALNEEGCIAGKPACEGMGVCDVLMFTGEGPADYIVLNEEQQKDLLEEADIVAGFAKEYQALTAESPDADSADSKTIEAYKDKKEAFLERASTAGLFALEPEEKTKENKLESSTEDSLADKIKKIEQRKAILNGYYSSDGIFKDESSVKVLQNQINKVLEAQLGEWQALCDVQQCKLDEKAEKEDQKKRSGGGSSAQGIKLENLSNARNLKVTTTRVFRVFEAFLVTQQRIVYIREDYVISKKKWSWTKKRSSNTHLNAALASGGGKAAIAKGILQDIKKDIVKDKENGAFGKLEGKWLSNSVADLKYKEWSFTQDFAEEGDKSIFATSGEAQLMRFCLHTDVKSVIEPKDGQVDIGASVGAEASLLEGKITSSVTLPHSQGYYFYIVYKDANGKDAQHPLGQFRLGFNITLSCFVGVTASAEVGVSASMKKTDGNISREDELESSGATVLLARDVGMGVQNGSSSIGLKGAAFAGAQVGGQVEGNFQWERPEKRGEQQFNTLAGIKAMGNVSLGAAFGGEFQLALVGGKFIVYCKASLAFGPGGSGGFGTTVDFKEIWPLAKIIWEALKVADYRTVECINEEAYQYLCRAAFYYFTLPLRTAITLVDAINSGAEEIAIWWLDKTKNWIDQIYRDEFGQRITAAILNSKDGTFSGVDMSLLPPETIGMLLDVLVDTFLFRAEEDQEKAINKLLKQSVGRSWRKLEEVLAHMNPEGVKQSGDKALFDNLARINHILDGTQQRQFNSWVAWVAEEQDDVSQREAMAFQPLTGRAFDNKLQTL